MVDAESVEVAGSRGASASVGVVEPASSGAVDEPAPASGGAGVSARRHGTTIQTDNKSARRLTVRGVRLSAGSSLIGRV
jgi:hypothetical protein